MGKVVSTGTEPPPELNWPNFRWRVGIWLTIASTVLTFILFVFPELSQGKFDRERISLAVAVALLPFVIVSAFPWLFKAGRIVGARAKLYPRLICIWKAQNRDLTEVRGAIAEFVQRSIEARTFDIDRACFTKGRLYVLVARKSGHEMVVGDTFEVVDREDNMSMGQFKVTEVRGNVYYAYGISHVDPNWLGYVQERGEVGVVPNIVAIQIAQGGQNG